MAWWRSEQPDPVLVAAARRSDREALAVLLGRHRSMALLLCTRMLGGDADLAEDATQEAVLHAMLSLDRLERPDAFGSWLAGIALNICRRWLRERAREAWSSEALLGGRLATDPTEDGVDPEEVVLERDLARRVRNAVGSLPAGQREAVTLFYLAGLTGHEVAALLGIRVGAAKARLHKARARLRSSLRYLWREELMETSEETEWVTMRVADVRRSAKTEEGPRQHVVWLEQVDGTGRLPIWIGSFEATALAMALEGVAVPRPGSYQFTASLLDAAGARIREVRIERLQEGTFYAVSVVAGAGGTAEVDSRPSDAMNMAVLKGLPIRVSSAVLKAVEGQGSGPLTSEGLRQAYADGPAEIVAETQTRPQQLIRALQERQRDSAP